MPVPIEEASRFGIVITDDNNQVTEFEENRHIQAILRLWGFIFSAGRCKRSVAKKKDEHWLWLWKTRDSILSWKWTTTLHRYNGYWKMLEHWGLGRPIWNWLTLFLILICMKNFEDLHEYRKYSSAVHIRILWLTRVLFVTVRRFMERFIILSSAPMWWLDKVQLSEIPLLCKM